MSWLRLYIWQVTLTDKVDRNVSHGHTEEHLHTDHPDTVICQGFFGLLPLEVT